MIVTGGNAYPDSEQERAYQRSFWAGAAERDREQAAAEQRARDELAAQRLCQAQRRAEIMRAGGATA